MLVIERVGQLVGHDHSIHVLAPRVAHHTERFAARIVVGRHLGGERLFQRGRQIEARRDKPEVSVRARQPLILRRRQLAAQFRMNPGAKVGAALGGRGDAILEWQTAQRGQLGFDARKARNRRGRRRNGRNRDRAGHHRAHRRRRVTGKAQEHEQAGTRHCFRH